MVKNSLKKDSPFSRRVKLSWRPESRSRQREEGVRARQLFLVLSDKLLKSGKGLKEAKERIAKEDKLVAKGKDKINVGERRLDAAKLELHQGREQMSLAKGARIACAFGAAFCLCINCTLVSSETISGPDLYGYRRQTHL